MADLTAAGPPRVSVVVTCYNRERFLRAALDSVLAQTFDDFEVIVVDDCSTDASVAIAHDVERRDPRVRVFVNERNLGDYSNRNHGASLARGELLKYHDSDDVMYPHCLDVMVTALTSEPEAGFALSRGSYWMGAPGPMLLTPRMSYQREFLGTRMFGCGPGGALFRTQVFRDLGGFEDVGVPSDYVFWLRACARVPVALLPADLFWYRQHPDQELTQPHAIRQYARAAAAAWKALHDAECPLTPEEREVARRNQAFDVAGEAARSARQGDLGLALYRLRYAGLSATDWMRYLRLPRRNARMGTPFDDKGDYVVPAWVAGKAGRG